MRTWHFFMFFGLLSTFAHCSVVNMATMEEVDYTWIETGHVYASSDEWVHVETSFANFQHPIAVLSAPTITDQVTDFQPIGAVVDIISDNGRVSFNVQMTMPNCTSEWWTPTPVYNISVQWIVVEKGGYKINGVQMVVGSATVTQQPVKIEWPFTFGSTCNNPTTELDDDYMPGAVMTLQTINNYERQMVSPRIASAWYKTETNVCQYAWKYGHVFLQPPEGTIDNTETLQEETVGYLLFDMSSSASHCINGNNVLELGHIDLTDDQSKLTYREFHDFATLSVFGLAISYNGGDLPILRALKNTASSELSVYLQEDQCNDEEIDHRVEEVSYLLISTTESNCSGIEALTPTAAPTSASTPQNTRKHDNNRGKNDDATGVALAVVLPILILGVVAVVGFFARSYFLAHKGFESALNDSSSRSDSGLV